MAVLILHPTEELIFAKLQKELISELYEDGRIMYAVKPLWIEIEDTRWLSDAKHRIETTIELGDFEATSTEISVPVTITTDDSKINTKLILVKIHSGKDFTTEERQTISQKKQPVRQLKIFRLGIEKELSSNSKCITESKWIKLR